MVTIRAAQPTPEGAADLANAVGEAYQQLTIERVQNTASATIAELSASKGDLQVRVENLDAALRDDLSNAALKAERDGAVAQLVNYDTRIAQIDFNMALHGSGVEYFEAAEPPGSPAAPRPLRDSAAASEGDGKTVTSLNLAAAARGNGSRVLLVDGDERARGLTRMGGDDSLPGLADLTSDHDLALVDCLVRWKVGEDRAITVLPSGRVQGIAGLSHSSAFTDVMREIKGAAGLVVLDSPPILAAAESLELAAHVDGVVLVVEQGTPLAALEDVRSLLEMAGTPLLGYVFNRATRRGLGEHYAYGYGYRRS